MGFNVQGFAISKKFASSQELFSAIGLENTKIAGESTFEEASSSAIGDNEVYVTQVDGGVIVTIGSEIETEALALEIASEGGKAIRFLVGDTASAYGFEYFVDGAFSRSVMSVNGETVMEDGEPLEIEEDESEVGELIFALIEEVAGDSFYTVEPDVKSERYVLE